MKSIRSGKKSHEDDHELQPVRDDHHGTGPKIQQRSKDHPTCDLEANLSFWKRA